MQSEIKINQISSEVLSTESLFSVGQIRLAELSVFNWGSFNKLHTARIDPMGTLITGDNGSGKSTFIDGLMALLLPAGKATFNVAAAQGDRSDRSLLSYMRGSFGSAHDGAGTRVKSKRESAVVTGLRALYQGDDGSKITLAALFWTTQSSNSLADVKREYVIAKRDMTLKEMLDAFEDGNVRSFKQWLRDDPAITGCGDRFSDYQELYRKLLYMDNKNAPALLSRALGLKKIDDLTGLIRELVLEPSAIKNDAKKVVEEFADLVAIHSQLVDARKQKEHLSKLPELDAIIEESVHKIELLLQEKNSLPIYFGEIFAQLWGERIAEIKAQFQSIMLKIKQAEASEEDANELVERRHKEYLQLGGDKIESLQKDIDHAKERLKSVVRESSRYQDNAKELGLSRSLEEVIFINNQAEASQKLQKIDEEDEIAQDRVVSAAIEFENLQKQKRTVEDEIEEIEARPDSNIESPFQRMRDELVNALSLEKEQCMFIGELIDVKDDEKHWQGSIERALGGLRTTLIVPDNCYSMVTKWLNIRHTGLHVRVQVVNNINSKGKPPEFKHNGFLRKLIWKVHPYREWLKYHLKRFDLLCVANTEELDCTPYSMTQQGLMHMDRGRFEKKDQYKIDNRKRWNLGFSNKSRLALLNRERKELFELAQEKGKCVAELKQVQKLIIIQKSLWEKIEAYLWDDINTPYWKNKLQELTFDLQVLEESGDCLEQAKYRWVSSKKELKQIQEELKQLSSEKGGVKKELDSAIQERDKAFSEAEKGLPGQTRELLFIRVGVLTKDDLNQMSKLMMKIEKELDRLLDSSRNKENSAEKSAIGIMSSFRSNDKWQVFTVDWKSDIKSLPDYLEHLQLLEDEGLPNLVEQFIERLNKHATQSLARIKIKLESERDDILDRIDTINCVLKRTEFKPGSYLKLGSKKDKFEHVHIFEQHLLKVLSQVTSDDHEARFHQLEKVVEILEKASAPGTSNTLESMRLLDPRYQMSFHAEELDIGNGDILDVLESSSGKSGGEKESFAGTIVAASLAYVLTPDGYDRPVYSTVFLDEAFSNTAEAVSRRVLRVFKELHIHVNLITPYKNLNLARESARSLLIAERNQEKHDSHLCEVTWDEIDRRLTEEKEKKLILEASELGIEIDTEIGAVQN